MTKADIVEYVYTKVGGISKKESAELVDSLIELMKNTLSSGENIKITGFGNFVVKHKNQRKGINPRTKDPIILPQRKVLKFKSSQILRDELNEKA
jgi:integration host factor subunit alpha